MAWIGPGTRSSGVTADLRVVLAGTCGSPCGLSILGVPQALEDAALACQRLRVWPVESLGSVNTLALGSGCPGAGVQSSAREPLWSIPSTLPQSSPGWPHLLHPRSHSEAPAGQGSLGWPHAISLWLCPPQPPPKPTLSLLRLQRRGPGEEAGRAGREGWSETNRRQFSRPGDKAVNVGLKGHQREGALPL